MNNKLVIPFLILGIVILAGISFWVFKSPSVVTEDPAVTNFDDCAKAGFPVMESYPRQCRTPEGGLFVEVVSSPSSAPLAAVATGGCYIGGCSSQICSDEEGAMSTCEYREEYACYKTGRCERQTNGSCGWTQTPELTTCLNVVLSPGVDMK